MAETIRHQGTVENITGEIVKVRILQSSACSGCSAAKLCQSSESKEKIVDIRTSHSANYQIGDSVVVVGSLTQGLKATWWAYVLPLLMVIATVAGVYFAAGSDALAALAALTVLVVYYIIMYCMRSKFEARFQMQIEE
ncbi:MAG: SoxR reducing system RseC family protein [Bacteroidales bacterium]|nr:SoxR reducing system RseC family protein [Bacteroidales bacterium]